VEEKLEELIKRLKADDWRVRFDAARFLASIGTPAAVPLINALSDNNPRVLGVVISSLGNIGDPRAIDPLLKMLEYQGYWAVESTAIALASFGKDVLESKGVLDSLLRLLETGNDLTQEGALIALGSLDDTLDELNESAWNKVNPVIVNFLDGGYGGYEINAMAVKVLGELGGNRAIELLCEKLDTLSEYSTMDEFLIIRGAIAEALGEIGDLRTINSLSKALDFAHEHRKCTECRPNYLKIKKAFEKLNTVVA
jgi:HEAT repeat protein